MGNEVSYEWTNDIIFSSGNTPMGVYDDDINYRKDAVRVTKYVALTLGYPMVNIELHPYQIFTFFENAVDKYTSIINESNIKNNLNLILGTDRETDYTEKYINGENYNNIFTYSESAGTEFGAGGNVTYKKFKINLIPDQQQYDLKELIEKDVEGKLVNVTIDNNLETFYNDLSVYVNRNTYLNMMDANSFITVNAGFDKISAQTKFKKALLVFEYDSSLLSFKSIDDNTNFDTVIVSNESGMLSVNISAKLGFIETNELCSLNFKFNTLNSDNINALVDITTYVKLISCIVNDTDIIFDSISSSETTNNVLLKTENIEQDLKLKLLNIFDNIQSSNLETSIIFDNKMLDTNKIVKLSFNVSWNSDYMSFNSYKTNNTLSDNLDITLNSITNNLINITIAVNGIEDINNINEFITGIGNLINIEFTSKHKFTNNDSYITLSNIKYYTYNDNILTIEEHDLENIMSMAIIYDDVISETTKLDNTNIEVKRVFYTSPSDGVKPYLMSMYGMYNNYALDSVRQLNGGYTAGMFRRYLMPLHSTILASQNYSLMTKLYRPNYAWNIINNVLEISPVPSRYGALWIEYIVKEDRLNNVILGDDKVSDMSNAKYEFIPYSHLNQPARTWIKQYTLGLSKISLGEVRSKYTSVPIPDSDISLNGLDLKSEGQTLLENLETSLKESLERLTTEARVETQKNINENVNELLGNLPFPMIIG